MEVKRFLLAGLAAALAVVDVAPVAAQDPLEGAEWTPMVVRPTGRLVVPVFEGWYQNQDGTYDLVFGYFNMNTEEVIEIPLGPDNFIEPDEYDGIQPTHFDPVPGDGSRRHWGVFAVRVPEDFSANDDVVWTLTHRGVEYSIPGRIRSSHYMLDAVEAPARGTVAAEMSFEPDGPRWKGRHGNTTGPVSARVGEALPLSVWVDPGPRPQNLVWWFKHQGPGVVTFRPQETVVEGGAGLVEARTVATFTEPGDYLLRVKAVEDIGTIEFHCCWTNAYMRVTVTE